MAMCTDHLRRQAILGLVAAAFLVPTTLNAQCPAPAWTSIGGGGDASIAAILELPGGELVVGGTFTSAGGVPANRVAHWDGSNWSPLGNGLENGFINTAVLGLLRLTNGDIVAVGRFSTAGGVAVDGVAKWDGTMWSRFGTPLGLGWDITVTGAVEMANGDVVLSLWGITMGGRLLRWNGGSWSLLGVGNAFTALLRMPNDTLVVGGTFTSINGVPANRVAQWSSGTWTALGSGVDNIVWALTRAPSGDLIIGGQFSTAGGNSVNRVARWDGSEWHALGSGTSATTYCLLTTDNGSLLAGVDGANGRLVERWDGTSWSTLASGLLTPMSQEWVLAISQMANGDIALGGSFRSVGGDHLAKRRPCPFTSMSLAVGCASSGGANTLAVTNPPLVDATFRARAQGLPADAIAVASSSTQALPMPLALSSVFAVGLPGCSLYVTPDLLQALPVMGGEAESSLLLPAAASVLGVTFYHQMVVFELDGNGDFVAVTATDALQLAVGAD